MTADGTRMVWIWLARDRGRDLLLARVAHELQHAVELAGNPQIVDDETLSAWYHRYGFSLGGGRTIETYETRAAPSVEREVLEELVTRK